jgi:hypothetical protein
MIKTLVLCACAFVLASGGGGGGGGGRRPPPPERRQPRLPDSTGGKADKKLVLAANGFNVEVNGELESLVVFSMHRILP